MTKPRSSRSKPKAKSRRRNGDFTPSKPAKKPYTKERVAGLEPAWEPGQSGNPAGRPLGARSRLNEAFLEALGETWARHGPAALEWLATNDKGLFVQVVASLIPRNAKLDVDVASKPVYWIADRHLTAEEWAAKWAEPDKPN